MRAVLLIALALAGAPAFAQMGSFELLDDPVLGQSVTAIQDDMAKPGAEARFRAGVGLGVGIAPNFPGSDRYRTGLAPVVFAGYGPMFFALNQIGVRAYRDQRWIVSGFLALNGGRKESEDARLQGLGNINRTFRAGVRVTYREGPFIAVGQVSTDVAGENQGTIARLDLFGRTRAGERTVLYGGPGLTWVDKEYAQSYFGVTAEQSANSNVGLRPFNAGSGVNSVRLSGGAFHRFGGKWIGMANLSAARLTGDATHSPITEVKEEFLFFSGLMYVF